MDSRTSAALDTWLTTAPEEEEEEPPMYTVIVADRSDRRGALYEQRLKVISDLSYDDAIALMEAEAWEQDSSVLVRIVDHRDMGTVNSMRGKLALDLWED